MKIIIIGAGAAGLMAASQIASQIDDTQILILEKNEKAGKKLYITGKGRCNVTNLCSNKEFCENVVNGDKFLLSSINAFSPFDTYEFFENAGVKLKVERGNRVFPNSDKSSDIISALLKAAEGNGAKIKYNSEVTSVTKCDEGFMVCTSNDKYICDRLVVTCGGMSYPQTGSSGSGYSIAKAFSHSIITPRAALVPIILNENVKNLQGLSLKNVKASIFSCDKIVCEQFGEMLFTDNGVSGPIILSLSSKINRMEANSMKLKIDLKPALSYEKLDSRVLSDFLTYKNKQFKNALSDLLPRTLIPYIISYTGINEQVEVNSITKAQRQILVSALKELTFSIKKLDDISKGIVTAGGINLQEISPKTMESKLVKGLFFAGEVLDLDALTGGFNIQIALSTGYAAGKAVLTS